LHVQNIIIEALVSIYKDTVKLRWHQTFASNVTFIASYQRPLAFLLEFQDSTRDSARTPTVLADVFLCPGEFHNENLETLRRQFPLKSFPASHSPSSLHNIRCCITSAVNVESLNILRTTPDISVGLFHKPTTLLSNDITFIAYAK